jgi:hypothetical protein
LISPRNDSQNNQYSENTKIKKAIKARHLAEIRKEAAGDVKMKLKLKPKSAIPKPKMS